MAEDAELPDEVYGFGNLLLWMVATRAAALVDQVYEAGPARAPIRHGKANGHYLPTESLIAWLLTATEFELPPERLSDCSSAARKRQRVLRAMVSRAMGSKPHLFRPKWIEDLAAACGLNTKDVKTLLDGRDEVGTKIDYPALRTAIEHTLQRRPGSGAGISSVAAVTRTLPQDVPSFTGRATELQELADIMPGAAPDGTPTVCAIYGMAGAGKTSFAVHFARQFPRRLFLCPALWSFAHSATGVPNKRPVGVAPRSWHRPARHSPRSFGKHTAVEGTDGQAPGGPDPR